MKEGLFILALLATCAASATEPPRWWKGNLHTHTLWSDGDDYPEMVVDWYKQNGYHFLAISDHNITLEGEKWIEARPPVAMGADLRHRGGGVVLEKYLARFGAAWVAQREAAGRREVRLKTLAEFRPLFEEPGRFLLIPSEEISTNWVRPKTAGEPERGGPVHLNATNIRDRLAPITGEDALTVMQRNVDQVLAQRAWTGQPMFPHLNHPNYLWGITAEELMRVQGERFFEVYNGHFEVHNAGDESHLGTEAMWDAILAHRLTDLGLEPMFGIAVDDAHHYHTHRLGKQNAGRGWVMVRAAALTPEAIVHAMEAGDFYATTGVVLTDVRREDRTLRVEVAAEAGVDYTVRFIGTRRDFDRTTEPLPAAPGSKGLPHRRYSRDVGAVLAEVRGTFATYTLQGDELYVRAKVISTKPKPNASTAGEFEVAWTQPLVAKPD
jgi:hypothetical protein